MVTMRRAAKRTNCARTMSSMLSLALLTSKLLQFPSCMQSAARARIRPFNASICRCYHFDSIEPEKRPWPY